VISGAENSNKFQKTSFWKEKSVEVAQTTDDVHLEHDIRGP
jgi:hypothetical protein